MDDLKKRLNDCAQWKMLRASDDPRSDEFDNAPFEAADRITTLEAALKEAREALKPFAEEEALWGSEIPDDADIGIKQMGTDDAIDCANFKVGDLRRAARALSPSNEGDGNDG